jgi:hypothetical protein
MLVSQIVNKIRSTIETKRVVKGVCIILLPIIVCITNGYGATSGWNRVYIIDGSHKKNDTGKLNHNFRRFLDLQIESEGTHLDVVDAIGCMFQCTEDEAFAKQTPLDSDQFDLSKNPEGKLAYIIAKKVILVILHDIHNNEERKNTGKIPKFFRYEEYTGSIVKKVVEEMTGVNKEWLKPKLAKAEHAVQKCLNAIGAGKYVVHVYKAYEKAKSSLTAGQLTSTEDIKELRRKIRESDIIPHEIYRNGPLKLDTFNGDHNKELLWQHKEQGNSKFCTLTNRTNSNERIFIALDDPSNFSKLYLRYPKWNVQPKLLEDGAEYSVKIIQNPYDGGAERVLHEQSGNIWDGNWPPVECLQEIDLPQRQPALFQYTVRLTGQRKSDSAQLTHEWREILCIPPRDTGMLWGNYENACRELKAIMRTHEDWPDILMARIAEILDIPYELLYEAYTLYGEDEEERYNRLITFFLLFVHNTPPLRYLVEYTGLP